MEEYLIYLEQYYIHKNGFTKNNICKKCNSQMIFKERKHNDGIYELVLSCDDKNKKSCGIQFTIKLPKNINIFSEINKLKDKINLGLNHEILSKYINTDKFEDNSIHIKQIEELENLFIEINKIEENYNKIEEILKNQKELFDKQDLLLERVKEDINIVDKKTIIKEYLETNKKLKENYKEISIIKNSIKNISQTNPPEIIKGKNKMDKSKITSEDSEEKIFLPKTPPDKPPWWDGPDPRENDDELFDLELDDGSVVKVESLSPDSPRVFKQSAEEHILNELTNVEKLFQKNKDKFNQDEEEICKETVVWEELLKIKNSEEYYKRLKDISTNPKYEIFNQVHFHAGDEQQFERYGFIKSRYLKYTENPEENKELKLFNGYNLDTTYKTFEYIFNKLKKGIYVSFKNNELDTFIPFSNINYINNWSDVLEKSNPELLKTIVDKKKYGRNINVSDPSKWYANNCIFKTDNMKFKFKDYVSEGDKTVIPLKYFLIGFQNYMESKNLKLDDMDFFFNPRDFPILKKDYYEPYEQIFPDKQIEKEYQYKTFTPILSQSGNNNYDDLLSPTEDDMLRISKDIYPDSCKNKYIKDINFELDFSKKKPICVFRGSATGCGITTETNMRLKAAQMSYDLNEKGIDILDAKLTGWNKKPKMYNGQLDEIDTYKFPFKVDKKVNFMDLEEQSKHKYILNIDGHVKAFRLGNEFRMGSVILLVDSDYTLWFQKYLKDKVNYILIDKNLNNLEEKINWCIENEDKCKKISENGLKLYNDYLTPEKTYEYFYNLLISLSKIRKEPIIKENNMNLNIIVAYRNSSDDERRKQLLLFKSQMSIIFKERTNLNIFVIEQEENRDDYDTLPDIFKQEDTKMAKFNLGVLKNIGFSISDEYSRKNNFKEDKTYYVLSDVDLLPSYNLIDDYLKYPNKPIHLGNLGTRYNENDSDPNFLGGVISFKYEDFVECNGYPNNFWGWGGEDNVLLDRLKKNNIDIEKSQYPIVDLENLSIDKKQELLWKNKLKMNKDIKNAKRREDKIDNNWQKNGLQQIEDTYEIVEEVPDPDINNHIHHYKVFLKISDEEKKKKYKKSEEKEYIKFKFGSKEGSDLSNFAPIKVILRGKTYKTGEHAFHGLKYIYVSTFTKGKRKDDLINYAKKFEGDNPEFKTSSDAKKAGGKQGFELNKNEIMKWNKKSMDVQYRISKYKVDNNKNIYKLLENNKDTIFIHQDNRANEKTIWGARIKDGKQIGKNELGKTWMRIRDEHKKEEPKKEEPKKEEPKKEEPTELEEVKGFKKNMKVSWTNKKGDIFIGDIKELKERFAIVINQDKKEMKLPYLKLTEYKEPEKKETPKKESKPEKKVELEKDDFREGDKVKWIDSKGNQEGTITKKNAKTVEIKSIKGENKRVPYKKLGKI